VRVVVITGGGLGNQIQTTAAIDTLEKRLGFDVEVVTSGAPVAGDELRELIPWPAYSPRQTPPANRFDGCVALGFGATWQDQAKGWRGIPFLNDLSRQAVGYETSEVDTSLNACRDLGVIEGDLGWHGRLLSSAGGEHFDVVLADNHYRGPRNKPTSRWNVKGYPGFDDLAEGIQRRWPSASVCCIGVDERERVAGVVDRTGVPLAESVSLIENAGLLVTTDSMAFHAAGCFETPTVAIWTATSATKNAEPRFHATARYALRGDLVCRRDCQEDRWRWRRCKRWECQEIPVDQVIETIGRGPGAP
jgi:hypothetical protein